MPDLRSLKRRWQRFKARPQEEEQGGTEQRRGKRGERGELRRNSRQLQVLPRQAERGHGGGGQPRLKPRRNPPPPPPPQGPGAGQDQRGGQAGQELGSHPVRPLHQEAVAGLDATSIFFCFLFWGGQNH